ncbi:pre-mRNA-splicing factor SYF2 [Cryptosporidium sp. chipmunk genotype I]|uniref:pre-mRNA-splicing factor SYF2 n=1 Tax=Cryptosporidium sp. chipmunk genotype I TaxID=1280935 RepID=UPI00351A0CE4|nr:pre-mRNA-splicing factor SYF2 [Cryptosporidium sp. chipmunk genotype I]
MITEKKENSFRYSFKFLFHTESGIPNKEKEVLKGLNLKVQSAMICNMEVFGNERKKELDKLFKFSNEEFIEGSALRVAKNDSKLEYTHDIRFDSTELWKIRRCILTFENETDNDRIKTKNRKREGLILSTSKIIRFDKEKYEQQMSELKANPERFEFLRTSHVPSDDDKNLLINQYLKNQRKSISESLDIESDIYHINEGNKRYNEKLDRAYHEFTTEIKQNLERGTAL